jgi:hypothetical protein
MQDLDWQSDLLDNLKTKLLAALYESVSQND